MVKKTIPADDTTSATPAKAVKAKAPKKETITKVKTAKKDAVETKTTTVKAKAPKKETVAEVKTPTTKEEKTSIKEEKSSKKTETTPTKAASKEVEVKTAKPSKEQKEESTSDETDEVVGGFEGFGLREGVLKGIEKAGYTTPTDIQTQVIDRFVHGNHIVGQSQTGTGKTAAFVIPLINAIDFRSNKLQAIVMAPTRELVVQTEEEFYKLARGSPGFKTAAAYGGGSKYRQLSQLERGAQVLVATPGRLLDYLSKGKVRTEDVKYFVLDEADRMLDMGFQDDIEEIVNACSNIQQMMSFSATITQELNNIITRYIGKEYDFIKTNTEIVVDNVDHSFVHVANIDKITLLDKFLNEYKDQKVIIFTQTKRSTDEVAEQVHAMGHKVAAIHGDIDQRHRMRTIKDLKSDYLKILVATDVAARGLNLNDVQLVINYEVPQDPESYIHRIGRTARAGKSGRAITFADNRELSSLKIIERRNKLIIKQIDEHGAEVAKRIIDTMRSGGSGGGRGSRFGGNRGGGGRSSGRFDGGGSSDRGGNSGGGYRGNSGGNDRGGYQGGGQGGYQGGGQGGYQGRSSGGQGGGYAGRSSQSSSNDRPDYSSSPSQRGGNQSDRGGNSGGGYRGNSGGNDRGGYQGGGQGGYQGGGQGGYQGRSSGGQGGGASQGRSGAPRGGGRDQGYRYRDDREAAAREGNYGTPPSKKPDVMFEPRQEYY